MRSTRSGLLAICPPSEPAYTSFSTDEGIRSPRTPTYVPDSMAVTRVSPYDHTRVLEEDSPISSDTRTSLPPTPDQPLSWIWICHLCHSRYPLGATRRCLIDGHYYCSGEANQPNLRKKKKKKKQSCTSEFDYVAWREWGDWRKKAAKTLKTSRMAHDGGCDENCVYPSQCRYPCESKDPLEKPLLATNIFTAINIAPDTDMALTTAVDSKATTSEMDKKKSSSTSNEHISFDQILDGIFTDGEAATKMDAKKETAKKKGNGKRKDSQQSSLEEEMAKEASRAKEIELVGVELWNNLEDIDLGNLKRKVD